MSIQVISFNCLLKNKAGKTISSTYSREVMNGTDGQNSVLSGLSKGLQNLSQGERRTIQVSAEEAYGLYDPAKVIEMPRHKLPRDARIGESISVAGPDGKLQGYKFVEMIGDNACLDGNHPLAGQDLVFEIEALAVREATREEIEDSMVTTTKQVLH